MDSSIHLIAGKLLFSIGAYEDAIKAFSYSPSIDKNRDALLSRTKCYIYLKELNLSLKDMEKLIELGDKHVEFDFHCLSALKEASKSEEDNFRNALQKITLG
jgi:tetratricopeptide (TPR) repeat protein